MRSSGGSRRAARKSCLARRCRSASIRRGGEIRESSARPRGACRVQGRRIRHAAHLDRIARPRPHCVRRRGRRRRRGGDLARLRRERHVGGRPHQRLLEPAWRRGGRHRRPGHDHPERDGRLDRGRGRDLHGDGDRPRVPGHGHLHRRRRHGHRGDRVHALGAQRRDGHHPLHVDEPLGDDQRRGATWLSRAPLRRPTT